jgi:hypothetical protein
LLLSDKQPDIEVIIMTEPVIVQQNYYTIVSNDVLKDKTISARAKGVYAYLVSNKESFKIYRSEIVKHFSEGRDAIYTAFDELVDAGWIIKRVQQREKSGRYSGVSYLVVTDKDKLPVPEKPETDYPAPENPSTDNPSLINNNSNQEQLKSVTNNITKTSKTKKAPDIPQPPDYVCSELWDEYLSNRKEMKPAAPNTPRALRAIINHLDKFEAIEKGLGQKALEETNESGWKSPKWFKSSTVNPSLSKGIPGNDRKSRNKAIFEEVDREMAVKDKEAQEGVQKPSSGFFDDWDNDGVTING